VLRYDLAGVGPAPDNPFSTTAVYYDH